MTWRDNLPLDGRGSFRGVEFFVSSVDTKIGRMTVVHKFPGRERPDVEDMGRAPREFKLVCYVMGTRDGNGTFLDDYDVQRDRLRVELEKAGEGQLVHPYWGEFNVRVTSPVSIVEKADEGGVARFELEVVETSGPELTQVQPDLAPVVQARADAVNEAAASALDDGFSLLGAIEDVRNAAVGVVQTLNSKVNQVRRTVNAALSVVDDTADAINQLSEDAASLILAPLELAASIQGVAAAVLGAVSELDSASAQLIALGVRLTSASDGRLFDDFRARRALDAIEALTADPVGEGDLDPVQTTGSSQDGLQAENQRLLVITQRAAYAAEGARALSTFAFDSRTVVELCRTTIADALDEIASDAPDELWAALVDLRESINRRLLEVGLTLPEIVDHLPIDTRPALAIAYDVHGDASRADEIIARNEIQDPNFVPANQPVQVVADD